MINMNENTHNLLKVRDRSLYFIVKDEQHCRVNGRLMYASIEEILAEFIISKNNRYEPSTIIEYYKTNGKNMNDTLEVIGNFKNSRDIMENMPEHLI